MDCVFLHRFSPPKKQSLRSDFCIHDLCRPWVVCLSRGFHVIETCIELRTVKLNGEKARTSTSSRRDMYVSRNVSFKKMHANLIHLDIMQKLSPTSLTYILFLGSSS